MIWMKIIYSKVEYNQQQNKEDCMDKWRKKVYPFGRIVRPTGKLAIGFYTIININSTKVSRKYLDNLEPILFGLIWSMCVCVVSNSQMNLYFVESNWNGNITTIFLLEF